MVLVFFNDKMVINMKEILLKIIFKDLVKNIFLMVIIMKENFIKINNMDKE